MINRKMSKVINLDHNLIKQINQFLLENPIFNGNFSNFVRVACYEKLEKEKKIRENLQNGHLPEAETSNY